jgi:hypothetical protein
VFPILERCEHNEHYECIGCTTVRHAEAHPTPLEGCGICRFSNGTIQISPKATPSKRSPTPPRKPNNSWEKGLATDERGMPLYMGGKPLGVKEAAERRHEIKAARHRLQQDPHVFDTRS